LERGPIVPPTINYGFCIIQAFETYTKERAEIERAEKKKRQKEAKKDFSKLLEEAELNGKSTFTSFTSKWGKDPRFKAVEKMRDREDYFRDYVDNLYKKEKEQKKKDKEKAKEDFLEMLRELIDLKPKSKWSSTKKRISDEERYKNKHLDSSLREQLFRDYVAQLPTPAEGSDAEMQEADGAKRDQQDEPMEEGETKDDAASAEKAASGPRAKTAGELALEERKRQVEEELGEQLRERTKESERHRTHEQEQEFKTMLLDLVGVLLGSGGVAWR